MRTIEDVKAEIERATERRAELFHLLSQGHDPELAREHAALEKELPRLWDEQRAIKATLRFGERDEIIKRARQEERLERAA